MASRPSLFRYRLHGLTLVVDRPLARLGPADGSGGGDARAEVQVRFAPWPGADRVRAASAGEPAYRSPFLDAAGQPRVTVWSVDGGACSRFVRSDGLEVVVDKRGRDVWIDADRTADAHALGLPGIDEYLLGPVLALVLRRRGVVCLHASAIDVNGSAVAFAGREGAGKSSLAAALILRGHRLVTDDLAALVEAGDRLAVQPGAPVVQVRRGAIDDFARGLGSVWRLSATAKSDVLELDCRASELSVASPRTLAAVYVLDPCARTAVEPLTGASAVMALVSDSWARTLLDPVERAHEVDVVARLAERVPVKRVATNRSASLSALADMIEADLA